MITSNCGAPSRLVFVRIALLPLICSCATNRVSYRDLLGFRDQKPPDRSAVGIYSTGDPKWDTHNCMTNPDKALVNQKRLLTPTAVQWTFRRGAS